MSYLFELCSPGRRRNQKPTYRELEKTLRELEKDFIAAMKEVARYKEQEEVYFHTRLMLKLEGRIRMLVEESLEKESQKHSDKLRQLTKALEEEKKRKHELEKKAYSEIEELTESLFKESYELVEKETREKEKIRVELMQVKEELQQEKQMRLKLEQLFIGRQGVSAESQTDSPLEIST